MGDLNNRKILKGLIDKNEKVYRSIYKKVFPLILDYVSCNSGTYQDAEDVFQDAMLEVLRKIRNHDLTLTCSFTTFFWEICRRVWLKELRKRKIASKDVNFYQESTDHIKFDTDQERKQIELFLKHIKNLSKNCQKVLILHFQKTDLDQITIIMGYNSLQTCQDKKYRCKKRLMELIIKDPEYIKLKYELFIID